MNSLFRKGLLLIAAPIVFQLVFLAILLSMQRESADAERWALHSKAVITSAELEDRAYGLGYLFFTTHVSDPLVASVGLTVLDVLEQEDMGEQVKEKGALLRAGLLEMQTRHEVTASVGRQIARAFQCLSDSRFLVVGRRKRLLQQDGRDLTGHGCGIEHGRDHRRIGVF